MSNPADAPETSVYQFTSDQVIQLWQYAYADAHADLLLSAGIDPEEAGLVGCAAAVKASDDPARRWAIEEVVRQVILGLPSYKP